MSAERMRRVFEVNVLGAYLTAREAARRMSNPRRCGRIDRADVSAAARLGSPNLYVDYAGSKGAIDTLTPGLAKELAPRASVSTRSAPASSKPISMPAAASPTAPSPSAAPRRWVAPARRRKSPRRPSG